MAGSARSRPLWRSRLSLWCSCCADPASPRCHSRCAASMRPGKPPDSPPAVTTRGLVRPPGWRRPVHRSMCAVRANTSLPGSQLAQSCCPGWSSAARLSRSPSRVSDESGAATVLAAFLVAALVALSVGAIQVGAAVIARHRAQSAADLAALAGASRLPSGPDTACRLARSIGSAMGATVGGCEVDRLDVVVTCTVRLVAGFGGEARAVARAGPGYGRT